MNRKKKGGKMSAFALEPSFAVYAAGWIFSLIFTQALRSPLSAVVFGSMCILPMLSLLWALSARLTLRFMVSAPKGDAVKLEQVGFSLLITNESILPYPFAQSELLLPDAHGVRCTTQNERLYIPSLGRCSLERSAIFPYRGAYEIGISCVYVYDPLKLFRVRVSAGATTKITVLPRRLAVESMLDRRTTEQSAERSLERLGSERSEVSGIRQYRTGDHIKSVHWKLSSKLQELQVKEYSRLSGTREYVFCDTAGRYPTDGAYADDINEYAADRVIELCAAYVSEALRNGGDITLIWLDGSELKRAALSSEADFERIFRAFAAASLEVMPENDITELSALADSRGAGMVYVTARLNEQTVKGLKTAAAQGEVRVIYFSPHGRRSASSSLREREELCLKELGSFCGLYIDRAYPPDEGGG